MKPPLSPTVAAVFDGFLKKLQTDKIVDGAALERLRTTLESQELDSDSLHRALFGPSSEKS